MNKMKKLFFGLVLLTSVSAMATLSPKKCNLLAEKFASKIFTGREVVRSDCSMEFTKNELRVYHRCNISGSTGEGTGDFEMLLYLNAKCTKVTFNRIVGEE